MKGLSKGRYDETSAGEDDIVQASVYFGWIHLMVQLRDSQPFPCVEHLYSV